MQPTTDQMDLLPDRSGRRVACATHRKPLMMHQLRDHLIWDSRRARASAGSERVSITSRTEWS